MSMHAHRSLVSAAFAIGLLVVATADARQHRLIPEECRQLRTGESVALRVTSALRATTDLWGNKLIAAPQGPTYDGVREHVEPLLLARGAGGRPLTESGFHYLALAWPSGAEGSGSAALHVADGSQIASQRVTGRTLTVGVGGNGRERFGSCHARLAPPRLAGGYLPILETRYVDANGVRYRQESFAGRLPQTRSLVSFVRLTADAREARGSARIRFTPSDTGLAAREGRLFRDGVTVLFFSPGGFFDGSSLIYEVPRRGTLTAYLARLNTVAHSRPLTLDRRTFQAAMGSLTRYWERRLAEGARIDVPEERVANAVRNLLVQNLGLTWRYSVGNPYQQLSFPESLDVAQVMSAYGFSGITRAIVLRSLEAPSGPYANWRIGQRLVAVAFHHRLFRSTSFVEQVTPTLRGYVDYLGAQLAGGRRILQRERYSSDVPDLVYGLHSQAVVWQGLRAMGEVWADAGRSELARRSLGLAARLEDGLRAAVRTSQRPLVDGSLFVPTRLLDSEPPYESVTETRSGSYWNLVVPYALASGLFVPRSPEANGALAYLLGHGSRLLGLVRTGAYSLYGRDARYPTSGVNPVYGLNVARFLADNDQPDQLVLSLYGQLAAGMSPGTFVSGEAASIAPLEGEHYRTMYLPPNGASNASFLETLRLLLVHETRGPNGFPNGLQLAYATPRAWLDTGKRIVVRDLPTSFGRLAFTIRSRGRRINVSIVVPRRSSLRQLTLRLRLPEGDRISGVEVNGRAFRRVDPVRETIDLSGLAGRLDLVVRVNRR